MSTASHVRQGKHQGTIVALALLLVLSATRCGATVLQGHLTHNAPISQQRLRDLQAMAFDGFWSVQTRVISSSCDRIEPGTTAGCQVRFFHNRSGALQAELEQPGWTTDYQLVTRMDTSGVCIQRRSENLGEDGVCTEESRDLCRLVAPDEILAQSDVDVYQDGEYIGRYHTESVFHRFEMTPAAYVCQQHQPEPCAVQPPAPAPSK